VAEAVEMARTLGELPKHVVLYGIEGESFETGGEITPAVRAAVPEVARLIAGDIEKLGAPTPEKTPGSE
jgi:hydrogenase maturation protease